MKQKWQSLLALLDATALRHHCRRAVFFCMGDAIVEMQQHPKAPMTDEQDGKIKTSE